MLKTRCCAAGHGFADDAAKQLAVRLDSESKDFAEGSSEVRVANRCGIHKAPLEVRPHSGHEVERIGTAETPVLSLTLLIKRVGDDDDNDGPADSGFSFRLI